jgi:diaminopimelate epimerase
MPIEFYKYQGTGNDFILIDNRGHNFPKNNTKLVAQMCDRKFGIGADGLILLEKHPTANFTMVYYNSDGNLSTMCGNGGRCITHFAKHLGIVETNATFEAVDGMHEAEIEDGIVSLRMNDVQSVDVHNDYVFLDTGSPHHVTVVDDLSDYDVFGKGRAIRNDLYGKEGANVNFVAGISPSEFNVRTYERGVEDETLSCGTGVTAVALAMYEWGRTTSEEIKLKTQGGDLAVSFRKKEDGYTDIHLIGPAVQVYKGVWT